MWLSTHLMFLLMFLSKLVDAWFRVACTTPLVQERLDPIISPGISPSNHVHTIHGANHFASNSTYFTLRASTCTNCLVIQDQSNYCNALTPLDATSSRLIIIHAPGFPKLYFHDPNTGLFEPVPNGGLLVYYQNRGNGDVSNGGSGIKAFPAGFKMISGNPVRRSRKFTPGEGSQGELAERAVEWECLRYTTTTGYNSLDSTTGFPTTDCEAGLNARIHMPACWDGVNVDSPNHISHTAYLSDLDNGSCPSTHPVPLMKILYEVTWDVHSMASRWDPIKHSWPFVWSTGDPTGYSWHGDFQNGWDTMALQNAIDKCNNPNDQTGSGITEACSFLTVSNTTLADECKIAPTVDEIVDGQLTKLPGCNPIQSGPQDATVYSELSCPNGFGVAPPTSGTFSKFENAEKHMAYFSLAAALLILARFK